MCVGGLVVKLVPCTCCAVLQAHAAASKEASKEISGRTAAELDALRDKLEEAEVWRGGGGGPRVSVSMCLSICLSACLSIRLSTV